MKAHSSISIPSEPTIRRQERQSALNEVSSFLAAEIREPMGFIRAQLEEVTGEGSLDFESQTRVEGAMRDLIRMESLLNEILDFAEKLVFEISQGDRRRSAGFSAIQGLLAGAINRIEELYESGTNLTGISTGFSDLDTLLNGFKRSDLIVLAARPSVGKSALALAMARNISHGQQGKVAVFSLEMSGEQVASRLVSAEANVDSQRLPWGCLLYTSPSPRD
mgnify:CR=1 FL=1